MSVLKGGRLDHIITMRVVGLVSGGKDSIYNLMECVRCGHEIVVLANLRPRAVDGV